MPDAVVDTNVLLRLILPSQRDDVAIALWQHFAQTGVQVFVPSQGVSEAMANLRKKVHSGQITAEDGDRFFEELTRLAGVMTVEASPLGAWEVAKRLNRPDTYDCEFYSLAEQRQAELWTADDTFVRAMGRGRPAWVKRLEDFQPAASS